MVKKEKEKKKKKQNKPQYIGTVKKRFYSHLMFVNHYMNHCITTRLKDTYKISSRLTA